MRAKGSQLPSAEPTLARTCRQIRQEALSADFRLNDFRFECGYHFRPLVTQRVEQMRHITIRSVYLRSDIKLRLTTKGAQKCDISLISKTHGLSYASHAFMTRDKRALEAVEQWMQQCSSAGFKNFTRASLREILRCIKVAILGI